MKQKNSFQPLLSIIIINYRSEKLLSALLNSIKRYDRRLVFAQEDLKRRQGEEEIIPTEIIVIDNNSCPNDCRWLSEWAQRGDNFIFIRNRRNRGFAAANNQGMRRARGQYLLLLNPDTYLREGAISQTVFWLAAHPEYDLIGCRLLEANGNWQPSVGQFPSLSLVARMLFLDRFPRWQTMRSPQQTQAVDWVMGAFMLLRREVFEKSRGFDEHIFMYMEEVEWCYRLKQLGFRVGFYGGAKIYHLGGQSSPERRYWRIWQIYRGLIYFYRRYFAFWQLLVLRGLLAIKAGLALLWGLAKKDKYLQKTYYHSLFIALGRDAD